ncbi:MAG: cytochrome P450 [Sphingomonadales bacterium]|nr:cytochrome P450 [Sphingomonadales bacterium]MBK6720485.1 cytochrome P450 [Sphingomonadales bacterium]MBK8273672.1 cytochrome P450 [Sphingomonadales bacterium]MBK9589292.1 cytochrome P450 [Sphingomonadales bacterium]
MQFPEPVIPDHVPASLVRPFPYVFGMTTRDDPFGDWATEVHKGPGIFYAPHAYPGGTPAWIVRRVEDLRKVYFDTDTFSSKDFSPYSKMVGDTWTNLPVEIDPPHHAKYRSFINPLFTPTAMTKLEGKIRNYAVEYIEAFRERGACEFMSEFAFEFPIKVFLELMDFPLSNTKQFLEWETGLLHEMDMWKMAVAVRNVVAFLREQIEDRRKAPRDDIISYALGVEVEGRKLNDDELVGFSFNLFIGGLDTVSTNMGLQFLHLARNPQDQQYLRDNPKEIPHAIDEMMRAYAAVTTFRTCTKETEFGGVKMMPGDKVAVHTTLAGRDPEEFPEPGEVRLGRNPRHVSFGFGPHMCVGMHLAKREMRIAIEEFVQRIPQFSVKPGHEVEYHLGMIQPVTLPLVW